MRRRKGQKREGERTGESEWEEDKGERQKREQRQETKQNGEKRRCGKITKQMSIGERQTDTVYIVGYSHTE